MEQYFIIKNIHCHGHYDADINVLGTIYTIGSDDFIYKSSIHQKQIQQNRFDLLEHQHHSNSIAVHPYQKDLIIIGGQNKKLQLIREDDLQHSEILTETYGSIQSIVFSQSGNLIGISAIEPNALIYDLRSKKISKCRPGHKDRILSVFFSPNQKFVCSTSLDGQLKIYKIDDKSQPHLLFNNKISAQIDPNNKLQKLRGGYNKKGNVIGVSGKKKMQFIQIIDNKYLLTENDNIRHEKQINSCLWQDEIIIITSGFDYKVNIWNYERQQKIAMINNVILSKMIRYDQIFIGINESGNIYQFKKPQIFRLKQVKQQINDEGLLIQQKQLLQKNDQQDSLVSLDDFQKYKQKIKSKAHILITTYPQVPLIRTTEYYRNNKILYFNQLGFIYQNIEAQIKSIYVQYYQNAKKKKKIFTNKNYKFFQIQKNYIAYADQNQYGLISDYPWQHKIENCQAICMGSNWIAAITDQMIKISDLNGYQYLNIAISRPFVTCKGYQNLLAIVFHQSPPILGSQRLRIKIFETSKDSNVDFQQTFLPLKPGSILKSFGISPQGMIFTQDSTGKIRVWLLQKNQWLVIFQPKLDLNTYRFIGLVNYEILVFTLGDQVNYPTVQPKSQLKKWKVCIPTLNVGQAYQNQVKKTKYGQVLWKKYILSHERFRNRLWYKHKLNRDIDNAYFDLSNGILQQSQIMKRQNSLQTDFVYLIKNWLKSNEAQRAYVTVKTFIRTKKLMQKISQIFEQAGLRIYSIKIQTQFEQKQKIIQYEQKLKLRNQIIRNNLQKKLSLIKIKDNEQINNNNQMKQSIQMQCPIIPFTQKVVQNNSSKVYKILNMTKMVQQQQQNPIQIVNPFLKKQMIDPAQKFKKDFEARLQKSKLLNMKKAKPVPAVKQDIIKSNDPIKKKK